jgi:RNA polymerase sigma-70 factor (ECF subfamily)
MYVLQHDDHGQRMKTPATSPTDVQPWTDELGLVRRARRGDLLAFDELTRRFRAKLVHWLRQRTGCMADAEDIAQEALLRAFQHIDRHDQQRPFSVWLYGIARRVAVDHSRKARPVPALDTAALADGKAADAEQVAVEGELRDNLWSIARRVLTSEQYSALWLRYAEEMPLKDVAGVLGRTRISTRVLLHRARQRLAPHVLALAEPVEIDATAGAAPVRERRQPPASKLGDTT